LLAGCFLALHFIFWIHSLKLTSVASSVTLVSTTPLFVALFSFLWLNESPNRKISWGILLTVTGSIFVAGTDFSLSRQALLGDLLAILGALMATGYLLTGSFVRRSLGLTAYIFSVYGVAALLLLVCCYLTGAPLVGFPAETYVIFFLLALVPQLIGHSTFNWALKFLSATVVAVLILGEPIGATLLAFLFLGETVSALKAVGLLVLGCGILICSLAVPAGKDKPAKE
jgi:drug/metabolite transporter (DMT)-like permease